MTIQQLESLLAVANHGSFSAAARYCFTSQPALSIQIQNLEKELGMILLDRNSKPLVPTRAGLPILEQARNAVAEFYALKEMAGGNNGGAAGKLRLGIIPSLSPYLLPRFIPEFVERCPDAELEILDMFQTNIPDALARDVLDAAIVADVELPSDIRKTTLFVDKIYAYVPPSNPLCKRDAIYEDDLEASLILTLNEEVWMCKNRDRVKSPCKFMNTSPQTLMHMADTSAAVAMIPGMALDYIPVEKRNRIKDFIHPDAFRTITMAVGQTYMKKRLIEAVKDSVMAATEEYAPAEEYIMV